MTRLWDKGGRLDALVMRVSEMLMSFPVLILVLLLVTLVGASVSCYTLVWSTFL